jgi:eukaryotic-like serine/threonine-protein kinase
MEAEEELGRYRLLKRLGQGGMGEVHLAYDSLCHRKLALKRIRKDNSQQISKRRFLREAVINSRLMHPSIIPVYSISQTDETIFYTMPYIEGQSLSDILRDISDLELDPRNPLLSGSSIPHMMRHFIAVCHALDYAHSQKILHRDIKPSNVMIGRFGEVYLCDWGISSFEGEIDEEPGPVQTIITDITMGRPTPGTVIFMAPEMASAHPSDEKTEIFALGVMLYQILTLEMPFHRQSFEEFKKIYRFERAVPPEEHAPHRDIPRQLSEITLKCLAHRREDRYDSVRELIEDLENFIEGRPEWIHTKNLSITNGGDWEFQENVLLAKNIAITRVIEITEWVVLMISRDAFSGNTLIETTVTLDQSSHGIGFLISAPEPQERKGLEDGYCLWIGSESNPGCTLFRNNVEVINIPDLIMKPGREQHITIERIDNILRLHLNHSLELNYHSHIPIMGAHIGVVYRDANFTMGDIEVSTGSQNVMVKCLSIPDAFLANHDFTKAFTEYQRIASSFKGRAEEREAIFRGGITLIEQAKKCSNAEKQHTLLLEATEQFERLRTTPGAPMEYLGKAIVYQTERDIEEEIKCLELAVRKFPRHPLIVILEEHVLFRLHETSTSDRLGAYRFALLSLRHLPGTFHKRESKRLLDNLIHHWETLPFINMGFKTRSEKSYNIHLSIQIAFWLSKPVTLLEIIEMIPRDMPEQNQHIGNALFALLEMGCHKQATTKIGDLRHLVHVLDNFDLLYAFKLIEIAADNIPHARAMKNFFDLKPLGFGIREARTVARIFEKKLSPKTAPAMLKYFEPINKFTTITDRAKRQMLLLEIKTHLFARKIPEAEALFATCETDEVLKPSSPLFPLYGCLLALKQGEKEALLHLSTVPDDTFPSSYSLMSHYLTKKIDLNEGWILSSFRYERLELFRYLELYYTCLNKKTKATTFRSRIVKEIEIVQKENHLQ